MQVSHGKKSPGNYKPLCSIRVGRRQTPENWNHIQWEKYHAEMQFRIVWQNHCQLLFVFALCWGLLLLLHCKWLDDVVLLGI